MKKDDKQGPQSNLNSEENSNQKKGEEQGAVKRLEDKPGAYLLKDKAADEETPQKDKVAAERSDLDEKVTTEDEVVTEEDEGGSSFNEDEFTDDELNLNPFDDDDLETQN